MDRPRSDGKSPWLLKLQRNLKMGGILLAVVAGVAMLPVVFLALWLDPPPEREASGLPFQREVRLPSSGGVDLAANIHLPSTPGPHPAFVVVHGSGRALRRDHRQVSDYFTSRGFAVLTYDKRGVGESTGIYNNVGPANSEEVLSELADDASAGVDYLRGLSDISSDQVGLLGFSQAGWIIPLAASRSNNVSFTVILSGPTVSVGEEIYYSRLTGDDAGRPSELTDEEISESLKKYSGPRGFDPVPHLRRIDVPGLWIFGGRDRSIQVPESIAILDDLVRLEGRDFTYSLHPDRDHNLRVAGVGEGAPIFPEILAWLRKRLHEGQG